MEQREATEEGVPVADLLQAVQHHCKNVNSFLTETTLREWLISEGFAGPTSDGRLRPTAEARGLVEALRWD